MNIYLIGMPGSGKSTIGQILAQKLNKTFIDLDHEIAKETLMFVDEIFDQYGEAVFRKFETEALRRVGELENIVVATGGGVVTVKENKALMNGIVIYLDTEIEIIEKRIKHDFPRPLLKTKTLSTLKDERILKYIFFADVIIDNDFEVEKTVDKIIQKLEKKQ